MCAQNPVSLFPLDFVFPGFKDVRCQISLHNVFEEVLCQDAFSGILLPKLQNLVLLGALDKLSGLMLLRLLDIHLPPVPQILGLLNFPDFVEVVPQHFLLQFVLLQCEEIFPQILESKYALTDFLEFSEDDVLFEAIISYLQQIVVLLLVLLVNVCADETLVLGLLQQIQLQMQPNLALLLKGLVLDELG